MAGTIPITTNGDFQFLHVSPDSGKFMKHILTSKPFYFNFS